MGCFVDMLIFNNTDNQHQTEAEASATFLCLAYINVSTRRLKMFVCNLH